MEFKIFQIAFLFFYVGIFYLAWKIKNKHIKVGLVALAAIAFMFNPVRFVEQGMSKNEIGFNKVNQKLTPKIIVKTESFEESQKRELHNLKQTSREIGENETK